MASTLPPDPYRALGVSKDADAAAIKAAYRKLALKCHPDKVTDESLKKQKQEEFHKIQQAYELIGDEDKRATYDAEVRLDALRREKLARNAGAPNVDVKSARYDVRTAAPAGAPFGASGPPRYEERKPTSRAYDDDRYHDRARKYDTYEAYPKPSTTSRSSRPEKEPPVRVTRVHSDRTRSDHKKSRDKDERKERASKFVRVEEESSADEKAHYEAEYKRRSNEAQRQRDDEEARKQFAEARRKADEQRRSYEDIRYDRSRKYNSQEDEVLRYISRSKADVEPRPSPGRTTSSRDARPEYHESRSSRRERPETARRSSARPKDRPVSSGRERDRKGGIPEIVEWEDDRKAPPSFKHSVSSPADIHVPRSTPQRSYTESSRDHRRETSPPAFRRSETMPSSYTTSSRRKEPTMARPSGLRSSETATPHESSSSSPEPTYPTVPPPQSSSTKTTKYYYATPGGGVRLSPEDMGVANGHRTILREPERHRNRSPSPLSKPPMGANRPMEKLSVPPPPIGRSATVNVSPVRGEERGRSRPLYGEIPSDYTKRENARRKTSYSPDQVAYSKKYGPEDIRWSGGRDPARDNIERGRDYRPATLGRHATYVY